jgi:hypothetical protein
MILTLLELCIVTKIFLRNAVFMYIPYVLVACVLGHPDTTLRSNNRSSWSGAGLKFKMCEPMRKWRITFNGLLRYSIFLLLLCVSTYLYMRL